MDPWLFGTCQKRFCTVKTWHATAMGNLTPCEIIMLRFQQQLHQRQQPKENKHYTQELEEKEETWRIKGQDNRNKKVMERSNNVHWQRAPNIMPNNNQTISNKPLTTVSVHGESVHTVQTSEYPRTQPLKLYNHISSGHCFGTFWFSISCNQATLCNAPPCHDTAVSWAKSIGSWDQLSHQHQGPAALPSTFFYTHWILANFLSKTREFLERSIDPYPYHQRLNGFKLQTRLFIPHIILLGITSHLSLQLLFLGNF